MDEIEGKYITREEIKKLAMEMMNAEIAENEGVFIVCEDDIEMAMMDRRVGWKLDEDRGEEDDEDK
jgi:hypothetical protein